MEIKKRCRWCGDNPLYIKYHDEEWGKWVKDDNVLFEFLILEGAQAGLNWLTILKKREGYREAFANFDAKKVALFDQNRQDEILKKSNIVRNRLKVKSAVNNAQKFLQIQQEFGTFYRYLWHFMPQSEPIVNAWNSLSQVPAQTDISDAISKDMKKRGFTFFGSTICYAFMQAVGMVDDHVEDCFCSNVKV